MYQSNLLAEKNLLSEKLLSLKLINLEQKILKIKDYVFSLKEENETLNEENELLKKQVKKEIKTEKPTKYIFIVKEKYIQTEIRLKPSDTIDKDFTINRYPENTNPDKVFDNEEDANNYVINRKEQIKKYKDNMDFPLNDYYYNSFYINEQHIFTISKELVI